MDRFFFIDFVVTGFYLKCPDSAASKKKKKKDKSSGSELKRRLKSIMQIHPQERSYFGSLYDSQAML